MLKMAAIASFRQQFFSLFLPLTILSLLILSSSILCHGDADSGPGANSKTKPAASSSSSGNSLKKPSLITINEDDWDQMLKGEWMVEFHAPWCPACRALQPEWKSFSSWSNDLGIKVGAVDVTVNPGMSGRFMVTALPTIYHVKDGIFRQYKGTRDTNSFVSFIEEKKWKSIDPISSWKAPNSIPMSIVSNFFKISMALRGIHNSLVEDYGIPVWGSYILFAFATILFGAILGLMIVCVIDIIFPAKSPEDISKPPHASAQGDLVDDSEINTQEPRPDGDGDTDDLEDEMGTEEEEDEEIEEEEEEEEDIQSQPVQTTNIRQRKARRD